MHKVLIAKYRQLRTDGWRASIALSHARTQIAWDNAGGYEHDGSCTPSEDEAPVRLRMEPEAYVDYDMLVGDCFTLEAFEGNERALKSQEKAFQDSLERDGVWILIGEYWNGEEWIHADSCGGFVGTEFAGHEYDIMNETLRQWRQQEHCASCKRPIAK